MRLEELTLPQKILLGIGALIAVTGACAGLGFLKRDFNKATDPTYILSNEDEEPQNYQQPTKTDIASNYKNK